MGLRGRRVIFGAPSVSSDSLRWQTAPVTDFSGHVLRQICEADTGGFHPSYLSGVQCFSTWGSSQLTCRQMRPRGRGDDEWKSKTERSMFFNLFSLSFCSILDVFFFCSSLTFLRWRLVKSCRTISVVQWRPTLWDGLVQLVKKKKNFKYSLS